MNNSFNFKVGFQQFANRCPESMGIVLAGGNAGIGRYEIA